MFYNNVIILLAVIDIIIKEMLKYLGNCSSLFFKKLIFFNKSLQFMESLTHVFKVMTHVSMTLIIIIIDDNETIFM